MGQTDKRKGEISLNHTRTLKTLCIMNARCVSVVHQNTFLSSIHLAWRMFALVFHWNSLKKIQAIYNKYASIFGFYTKKSLADPFNVIEWSLICIHVRSEANENEKTKEKERASNRTASNGMHNESKARFIQKTSQAIYLCRNVFFPLLFPFEVMFIRNLSVFRVEIILAHFTICFRISVLFQQCK